MIGRASKASLLPVLTTEGGLKTEVTIAPPSSTYVIYIILSFTYSTMITKWPIGVSSAPCVPDPERCSTNPCHRVAGLGTFLREILCVPTCHEARAGTRSDGPAVRLKLVIDLIGSPVPRSGFELSLDEHVPFIPSLGCG